MSSPRLAATADPFAIRPSSSRENEITRRWSAWTLRAEHESARLASSLVPRDTLLNVYQDTHRRAMLLALSKRLSLVTIEKYEIDSPFLTDPEREILLDRAVRMKMHTGRPRNYSHKETSSDRA